jgi:3-oxoacyl-[acyl-carrier protein] reductase
MRLEEKVALITGGTRGIGRELVRTFAREGAAVAFTGRSVEAGREVEREAAEVGQRVLYVPGSAASETDVQRAVDAAVETFGALTTIVNNAAATHLVWPGGPDKSVTEVSTEVLDEIVRTNLYGTFWACKYGIPHLQRAGGGAIVNVSAGSSVLAITGKPSYQASKGAINSLTRQLAVDYGASRIRANAILVGFINTGGTEMQRMTANEVFMTHVTKSIMFPRLGRPSDIANAAAFLASDDAEFITGVLLPVDGGMSCHLDLPNTIAPSAYGN